MKLSSTIVALGTLVCVLGFDGLAHAQSPSEGVRVHAYFAMGAVGQTRKANAGRDNNLDSVPIRPPIRGTVVDSWLTRPVYGAGVRVESPRNEWLFIGGMVEVLRQALDFNVDDQNLAFADSPSLEHPARRGLTSHYDVWVKFARLRGAERRVPVELYIGVPVGFTFSTLSMRFSPSAPVDPNEASSPEGVYPYMRENWYGWNTGVLAGSQFFFHDRFAMTLELGWRLTQVFNRVGINDTWAAVRSTTNYAALNIGAVLVF